MAKIQDNVIMETMLKFCIKAQIGPIVKMSAKIN